jgi:hypothetical protein
MCLDSNTGQISTGDTRCENVVQETYSAPGEKNTLCPAKILEICTGNTYIYSGGLHTEAVVWILMYIYNICTQYAAV